MAETLGDILLEQIVGPIVSEQPEPSLTLEERTAAACIYLSAVELCRQLAVASPLDEAALWEEMRKLPDDWLWKLNYPAGWSSLADYLTTCSGGVLIAPFAPTIH